MGLLGNAFGAGRRLAAWVTRSRRDAELREEIETHIAERLNRLVEEGMDPREAAYEARRQFGNPAAIREETRDMRSFRWLDTLAQDARFGGRVLLRTPLFSGVAVLSLALGIGAAVAVFNVADAVLFRQLPVRDPGALRSFQVDIRFGASSKVVNGVPDSSVAAIQGGSDFADFVGFRLSDDIALGLDQAAATRMSRVEFVTGNYFDVLGVGAAAGRLLSTADDAAAPLPVVVTEALWSTMGAGDALGRHISLNGTPAVVVGVAREFRGLSAERPADVFAPLGAGSRIDPAQMNFVVQLVARLRPGVTPAEAEQKLGNLYKVALPGRVAGAQLHVEFRDASRGVSGAREALTRPLWLGLALVGLLVMIACANTGGLLLSRFMARQGEFGIRIAIGAGRGRLARQLAVEALLVALAAALVGLVLGWALAPLLMRIVPETGSQVAFELRFDRRLVFFTAALTGLCAIGAASASMLRLWRGDSSTLLSVESRTVMTGSRRVTRVLIAAQVACSLLLVVGAVSMSRTLVNLRGVPLGFDPDRMFVVTVNAAGLAAPDGMSAYHTALHERIAAVPGVARATMAQIGVLTSSATIGTITVAGFTPSSDEDRISRMFFVGPDYFETMGMRVLAGRSLDAQDAGARTRTAVVNERFATFYFGSATGAVDQTVNTDVRIVGVVSDAHYNTPRDEPRRAMFVSHRPVQRSAMAHIVRAAGDPAATMRAVGEAVASHDSRLRPRLAMADELMATALARERFFAAIASVLSGLALVLACAGLYAAVAYSVTERHGELAVRVALGASKADVIGLVLRGPLFTTTIGIAAGIPGTYLLMRSARSLLFGVSAFDLPTVAVCGVVLLSCAALAALWPARRALAIDPVTALRNG